MKEKIIEEIEMTSLFGTISLEHKWFDDMNFYSKENIFKYRLSKISFFIEDKNGKEKILGLETLFTDKNGKEISNEKAKDKDVKESYIKTLEITPNDYICNFFIKMEEGIITQIKLITKKWRELIVGSDEGEDKIIGILNDNKDNMILGFSGSYTKCLGSICALYISFEAYYGYKKGFFELKLKLKDKFYKADVYCKLNQLNEIDKAIFRVCSLEDELFYSIIKYL